MWPLLAGEKEQNGKERVGNRDEEHTASQREVTCKASTPDATVLLYSVRVRSFGFSLSFVCLLLFATSLFCLLKLLLPAIQEMRLPAILLGQKVLLCIFRQKFPRLEIRF